MFVLKWCVKHLRFRTVWLLAVEHSVIIYYVVCEWPECEGSTLQIMILMLGKHGDKYFHHLIAFSSFLSTLKS